MSEGFVSFMRRYYYWVFVVLSVVAVFFGVFVPEVAIFIVLIILALIGIFVYYYYQYDLLKKERNPTRTPLPKLMKVEDVDAHAPLSNMPNIDKMVADAALGPARVKANIVEGSGMDLVERYVPLGEMLFPIAFIADKDDRKYQEGSLEIGKPLCLWHGQPVWFAPAKGQDGIQYHYFCQKCPQGGKPISKSQDETTKVVELIATSTLRSGKMQIVNETLMEASKRGRGELPG